VKKIMPALFFQKQLNGVQEAPKKPERLELFESELRAVVGGLSRLQGTVTYSFSESGVAYPSDYIG